MDENLIKMRKSCERIAAVLGLKDGGRGVGGVAPYQGRMGGSAEPVAPPQIVVSDANLENPSVLRAS